MELKEEAIEKIDEFRAKLENPFNGIERTTDADPSKVYIGLNGNPFNGIERYLEVYPNEILDDIESIQWN